MTTKTETKTEIVTKTTAGRFIFQLVRSHTPKGWRWEIRAREIQNGRPVGPVFVCSPSHWRLTDDNDLSPHRPLDAFSFSVENEIDPSKSEGWVTR